MMKSDNPRHFFILGAAKCGTTSLYHYLNQHSEICMSVPKEPFFFEKDYHYGPDFYMENCFAHWKGESWVGEARHRNLYLPYIPSRIGAEYPDAKLLVIIRNPVDRAFSHYLHRKLKGYEDKNFPEAVEIDLQRIETGKTMDEEEIERVYLKNLSESGNNIYFRTYIDSGYYADQITRYYAYFDPQDVKIIFLEDMENDPRGTVVDVLRFLDDKLSIETKIDFEKKNIKTNKIYQSLVSFKRKKIDPKITLSGTHYKKLRNSIKTITGSLDNLVNKNSSMCGDIRNMLIEHYTPHNNKLEIITGRNLSHWNK